MIFSTLLLIVFGENGLMDRKRLQTLQRGVAAENAAIAKENARLYRQIERLKNDPAYLETIARRELGMIGSKEVIVKSAKPKTAPDGAAAEKGGREPVR
ncbi:MAG: septum formation initiator family protein [Desulfobacterales bacterium]